VAVSKKHKLSVLFAVSLSTRVQMPEHRKTVVHSYAGLSRSLWSARVFEVNRQSKIHRQEDRLFGRNAVARRKTGCSSFDHQLFEKVSHYK